MNAATITSFPRRTPMTLLVLEDEALTRCLVADELRARGYLVAEASSVEDARAVLAAMWIDLAFLDLHIPGPASGLDLAHAVRDQQPHAKVILTSGKVWPESLGELQALERRTFNQTRIQRL